MNNLDKLRERITSLIKDTEEAIKDCEVKNLAFVKIRYEGELLAYEQILRDIDIIDPSTK